MKPRKTERVHVSATEGSQKATFAGRAAFALPVALFATLLPSIPAYAAPASIACQAEQSTEDKAVDMARRCGAVVTVTDSVTESDRLVATPNGTVTWEHQYRPVRVKRAGGWVPVDTTLERRADGTVGPKAAAVDMSFSGGGNAAMVTVAHQAASLTLGSPLGDLLPPDLDGDTATYREVLPDVDLKLRADVDGYSQVLVVKTAKAATNPRLRELSFAINGKGLSIGTDKASNLKVSDAQGKTVFKGNTPLMWDNTTQAIAGKPGTAPKSLTARAAAAKATRVTMPVKNDGKQLKITPSQKVLSNPQTTFPIYIDPGLTLNRFGYSVVNSATPDTAYWNVADDAFVGSWDGGASKHRSFFSMDLTGSQLAATQIVSAKLNLTQVYSATCEPSEFEVWATGVPNENTTWNTQPEWYSLQSSSTESKGNSASCPAGPTPMDVTSYIKAAADYGWNGVAFGVRATNETDWASWKRFANNPTLSVEYAPNLDTVTFGDAPSAGAATTVPEAYSDGAAPTAESEAAKDDFITSVSEESGVYYDPQALDYLALAPTAGVNVETAEIVVPKDTSIEEVTVDRASYVRADGIEAERTTASATSSPDPDAIEVAVPDGPGFAAFTPQYSGNYHLNTGRGVMLATWGKSRVKDDGSKTQDHWMYQRKGAAEPKPKKNQPDWYLLEFGIKSYPAPANPLNSWVDYDPKPGKTHRGDCNGQPITIGIDVKGVEITTQFQDCDDVTTYMRNNVPGDFSLNWNAPSYVPGRMSRREAAFTWLAGRKQPSTAAAQAKLVINDYQYFRMQSPWWGTHLCQSTNGNTNC